MELKCKENYKLRREEKIDFKSYKLFFIIKKEIKIQNWPSIKFINL